jgi:hypothetical protein
MYSVPLLTDEYDVDDEEENVQIQRKRGVMKLRLERESTTRQRLRESRLETDVNDSTRFINYVLPGGTRDAQVLNQFGV